MSSLKQYNVCVHKFEDLESLYRDLENYGSGPSKTLPDRRVECKNRRPVSRNTHYWLTDQEAEQVRQDSRVKFVELVPDIDTLKFSVSQFSNDWNKSNTVGSINNQQHNWGLLRCTEGTQRSGWGANGTTTVSGSAIWNYTGANVDVVICDGLFDNTHPELAGRRINYNWYELNPQVLGTPAGTYDYSQFIGTYAEQHSTHVAGIAIGNTHGWARSANVYNIYSFIPGYYSLDYIRVWHQNKPVNPSTGVKNPTIVNNSYESLDGPTTYSNISKVSFRGTVYNGPFSRAQIESFGLILDSQGRLAIPRQVQAIQEDYFDLIDMGVVVVGAAGNTGQKIDEIGGIDYNNYLIYNGNTYYYNRGSFSASADSTRRAICVGAISDKAEEYVMRVSARGPRVDVFSPGESINSSWPNSENAFSDPNYYFAYEANNPILDSRGYGYNYKLTGTSMATPQVTGILACIAGMKISQGSRSFTQADALQYLRTTSGIGYLGNQPAPSQYNLAGSNNRYLYFSANGTAPPPVIQTPTYQISPNVTNVNEGSSITYGITTQNLLSEVQVTLPPYLSIKSDYNGRPNAGTTIDPVVVGPTLFPNSTWGPAIKALTTGSSLTWPSSNFYDNTGGNSSFWTVYVNNEVTTYNNLTHTGAPNKSQGVVGNNFNLVHESNYIQLKTTQTAGDGADSDIPYMSIGTLGSGALTGYYGQNIRVSYTLDATFSSNSSSLSFYHFYVWFETAAGDKKAAVIYLGTQSAEVALKLDPNYAIPESLEWNWRFIGSSQYPGAFMWFIWADDYNARKNNVNVPPIPLISVPGTYNFNFYIDNIIQTLFPEYATPTTKINGFECSVEQAWINQPVGTVFTQSKIYGITAYKTLPADTTTLYWTNAGTTLGSDFSDGANSGSITVNSNAASFLRTLTNDVTTEGSESVVIQLRTGSVSGPVVATAVTVTVADTSQTPATPTYRISPNVTSINEGGTVIFYVVTTNVPNGTILYWTNRGTTTSLDFTDNSNNGSTTINNNSGGFSKTLSNDLTTEGLETIIIDLRTTSISGPVVATADTVTVNDTSQPPAPPTYTITPSTTNVNEGALVTFNISTTNVANGTTLYWTNLGTTNSADFNDNNNSGSFTINNGVGSFSKTLSNDLTTEGLETIIIQIRSESISGPVVATASTVTVNDTSQAPIIPTYNITPTTSSVNEGGLITFNISTTNVANSTTLYWTNAGTTNSSDFNDNSNNGSITITSGAGSFSRTLINDLTTEGSETIVIQLRTGSISGPVVATASTVTVNDTSQTPLPATYSVTPSTTTIKEGGVVTFNVVTTNVPANTILYWTNAGTISGNDLVGGINQGSFSIINNQSSITLTILGDNIVEGTETIIFQIRKDSPTGQILATANTVYVSDVAVNITPSTYEINEGDTVEYHIETSNISTGTTLYWTNAGTTDAYDFVDGINQGTVTVTSLGTATVIRSLSNDVRTEGNESIVLEVRSISYIGPVLARSYPVTVFDTSLSSKTYHITANKTSVIEGESVIYKITTTNVPDGSILYWKNTGTTPSERFIDNVNYGSLIINSNSAVLVRTLAANLLTNGDKTILMNIGVTPNFITAVATAPLVRVIDTSKTPIYEDISWQQSYIGEFPSRTNLVLKIKKE